MSRHHTPQRRRTTSSATGRVPRSARLGELLREVVAEEIERIADERLELVAITSVEVDPELNRAIVFFDAFNGESVDREIIAALTDHRVKLQATIARQIRARKTPILEFRPDEVIRSAERIDRILRDNPLPARTDDDYHLDAYDSSHGEA
jgi:ribosome-binding factor A